MVHCAAVNCTNGPTHGFPLHRFPKHPERRSIWVANVRRENWQPTRYSRLCDCHFDSTQFEQHRADGVRKLKPNAIPTVFKFVTDKPSSNSKKQLSKHLLNTPLIGEKLGSTRQGTFRIKFGRRNDHSISKKKDLNVEGDNISSTSVEASVSDTNNLLENQQADGVRIPKLNADSTRKSKKLQNQKPLPKKRSSNALPGGRKAKRKCLLEDPVSKVDDVEDDDDFERIFNFESNQMELQEHESTNESVKKALKLLFACGKTGYEILLAENHNPLPSISSLSRRMAQIITLRAGIFHEIFEFLKVKVASIGPSGVDCVLTLDEMDFQERRECGRPTSCTLPEHSGDATHALVFMLSGVSSCWAQTVGYHFTGDSVNGDVLKQIILEIIGLSAEIGLHVMCVTSVMGPSITAMHTAFGVSCIKADHSSDSAVVKVKHPKVKGRHLYFMYDVPRMMKSLKNSLVSGTEITLDASIVEKFKLPKSTVSFSLIKRKTLRDSATGRDHRAILLPKLVSTNSESDSLNKVKLSSGLNLFSESVIAGMRHMIKEGHYSDNLLTTVWFLEFMNHWIELLSSRHPVMALCRANTETYQKAIEHLKTVIALFETIKMETHLEPLQTGIIMSTISLLAMQKELFDRGVEFILTSRFSQDCFANLFNSVKFKTSLPSCLGFRSTLEIISIAQYLKCPSRSNYQEDDSTHLAELVHPSV